MVNGECDNLLMCKWKVNGEYGCTLQALSCKPSRRRKVESQKPKGESQSGNFGRIKTGINLNNRELFTIDHSPLTRQLSPVDSQTETWNLELGTPQTILIFALLMQSVKKEIVMGGIRPTGFLHLGNYFGALRNFVRMQDEYPCFFMLADLHSLTTHPDTTQLKTNIHRVLAEHLACGLDPDKSALYCQSHVFETSELYLYLSTLSMVGELEKTPTFKDKVRQHPQNVNSGLLTYPVLQAADILLHRAKLVPVGKDQEQHLEMARNIVVRFHHRYSEVFPEPVAFNYGGELIKVPSLDGAGKMSKSENQYATLYLSDPDDLIRKKVMKATTDSGPKEPNTPKPDYIENLFLLMKLVSAPDVVQKFEEDYNACTIRYGDMKKQLAEDMVNFIAPIREKAEAIQQDTDYLKKVMIQGAEKARASAQATMKVVRQAMGLNYY
jgi:tryptophanyl-tRNA synthetase